MLLLPPQRFCWSLEGFRRPVYPLQAVTSLAGLLVLTGLAGGGMSTPPPADPNG